MYASEIQYEDFLNCLVDFVESEGEAQTVKAVTIGLMFNVKLDSIIKATDQIKNNYSTSDLQAIELADWIESRPQP